MTIVDTIRIGAAQLPWWPILGTALLVVLVIALVLGTVELVRELYAEPDVELDQAFAAGRAALARATEQERQVLQLVDQLHGDHDCQLHDPREPRP